MSYLSQDVYPCKPPTVCVSCGTPRGSTVVVFIVLPRSLSLHALLLKALVDAYETLSDTTKSHPQAAHEVTSSELVTHKSAELLSFALQGVNITIQMP